jgi:hypothetical protein
MTACVHSARSLSTDSLPAAWKYSEWVVKHRLWSSLPRSATIKQSLIVHVFETIQAEMIRHWAVQQQPEQQPQQRSPLSHQKSYRCSDATVYRNSIYVIDETVYMSLNGNDIYPPTHFYTRTPITGAAKFLSAFCRIHTDKKTVKYRPCRRQPALTGCTRSIALSTWLQFYC